MAKLINRYALFDAIRNITYNSKDADAFFEEVLEVITEQPTTTEAEIRASVIDEALKALSIFNDREHGNEHFIYGIETAKEILEQLKEE